VAGLAAALHRKFERDATRAVSLTELLAVVDEMVLGTDRNERLLHRRARRPGTNGTYTFLITNPPG